LPRAETWFVVDWECCLGAGGEGEVFLGRSLDTWELCAIKVSTLLDPVSARAELTKEMERCARVAGDGVVGLVAWNLDAPRPFLVFEFARAGSLADEVTLLREAGHVYHPVRALERVREVLCALANVHGRGLVHRDVKPANLLRFGQRIKVADFGAGCSLDRQAAVQGDGFVGTKAYAAPELLRGEEVDERTDLYAVGCILREMLSGHLPAVQEQTTCPVKYPNLLVLPELDRLMRSLLAPQRSCRPRTAEDAIALVDSVLASYRTARRAWEKLQLGPCPY
jgi:serine/threonine protein kinase